MATEANIHESVCLKKGEREEDALASEVFEEKVTELPGNQVKQLETSSYMAEIVNTPLATGKPTDESGIFFQALSVTMVISDEHSNTPDSFKAAKQTEPEDKETTENEEKAIESVTTSQDTAVEEQELKETPREFVKEETEGKSVDAQQVTEQREIGSKNIEEQKSEESVEKIEEDEIKEIKPDIESEKGEQNGLLQAITSDTAISTHTKSQVETTEHEEEETKSDNPLIKEVCEEKEAIEHEVVKSRESIEEEADVGVSTQPTLVKESIKIEEKAIEKAELEISDSAIEREQGDPDGVTSSKESPCVDAEETTNVQHVTAEINFKERDLDEKPREFIKEETEDKSIDAPEVSEECVKNEIEQNPEESVKKEEDVKPSVEVEEKKEQDELMPVITNDVTISTQTNPQVETTEHEEKEQDINLLEKDQDEDDVTHAQEVTFEESLQEKSHPNEDNEHEAVKSKESLEKEADTLVKESINIEEPDDEKAFDSTAPSQKDQGDSDGVKSLQESPSVDVEETATDQHVTTEINLKEQDLNENPKEFKEESEDKSLDAPEVSEECEKEAKEEIDQNPEESVNKIDKEDETEEIKPGVEIEEKEEQDELLPAITKDEVKHSAIATVTKDENEDEEKEQDMLEKVEGEHDATSAQDVTFEKDLQEKNHHNEDDVTEVVTAEESTEKDTEVIKSSEETEQHMLINSIPSDVCISTQTEPVEGTTEKNDEEATETGQGLSALQRETIIEETKDRPVAAQEETEQYDDGANAEKEQKLDECVNETAHSTDEQEEHTEEIKPKVEATEEKDIGILTQTKFQEEATKNEENSIESDGVQKEKSDNPVVEELCEESGLKRTESKEEGQLSDSFNVKTRDIEDTEETKSSDVIGVSSSTQTEYIEKAIESKENNDEGQKEKLENPLVEEVCEATSSKMAESEEGVKHSESSSMTPTVDETLSKEEEFEKKDDIKASEAQGGENDATSSQHASTEDIKETTIGQHDTTVAHVEEGQGVSALPKEIPVEEAGDTSIDDEEMSLKLGQPNQEDEIKKEDKDLSHESVEDTTDDSTKEKCTLEQEPVEEHSGQNEISKEIVTDLSETTEVEPQEDVTPSTSFETSAEGASNSEKKKAESENSPTEDLETTSQLQIPELVPKSEDSMLKEECVISEKELHLDEEIGTVTKEISSDEKTEVQHDGDDVTRSQNAPNEDIQKSKIGQHDTTVSYVEEGLGVSATPKEILIEEANNKSIDAKEISHASMEDTNDDTSTEEKCKLEQEPDEEHTGQDEVSKEKVTDLNETTEVEPQDDITPSISLETSTEETSNSEKENAETTKVEHSERDEPSKENVANLNETTEVEPQEDITLSTSLKTSTEDPLYLEKEKSETENLSIEDLETVSEVKIPELVPKSEESVLKEECFISETKTHLNEENETITKKTSSDEKPEVQSDGEEVISSQNEPSVAYVEEGQGVSATPKEMLIDQAEDKSIDAEETSLKLGQPNEQNVEETISQNPEDEIKKEDIDLLHNSVEDTNDDSVKEEKCAVEHEPIEEHSGLEDVSKENVTELNETAEVEPQEDITPSISLKPSTEDTSNSAKEKAETEHLPLEDLETVSEVQIPELLPKSEESVLKEDCFISETETHLDEENRIVTEEISNEEKTELNKETVMEVCEETSTEKTEFEEGLKLSDTSYAKINEKEITFKDEDENDQEVIMSPKSQGEDNITSSQIKVSEEKEELQKKNSHNEGNEDGFIKSGEGVHEDTEEIKSSVETHENTEHVITTSSSTQIETNADSIKNEEKNDEKAVVNDENEIENRDAGLELKQEDIKETDMDEHATTAASIEEGQRGRITKEILYEAEGDESVTGQEKTEQHDEGEYDEEQKPEERTEEIKPSVETNEEKEVCISTQNESQEEPTKNEENVIEHEDQKENLDNLFVKEVCEESDSTKTESEERQVSDSSDVKTREIVDEDTEETKLSDVSSSTRAENIEKTTASDRNNDEETTVHDGQTEKPQSALVEVVYEATSSEIAESEEELKHSESFSTTLNENETLKKEEIQIQEDDIKTSEVKGSGVEVTNSQDTSNENIKETTIGQHDTTVAHVEEQCVSETPKETGIEEAEDKSVKAEEISLEQEEPNEQNVEETHPCPSETISGNPEDDIKKENKELSLEIVEDTNDDTTKEEKYALKHESVEEHGGLDEVSKEKLTNVNESIEVEPKEDITPSTSLETSTEDISNSEKEKIETENFPIEDLETVSEVQIPEVVPKSEESVLKEECFVSETETHFDEEKGAITEEISSDKKTEHTTEIKQETIKEVCEETSSEKAELEEGLKLSDTSDIKINEKELTTFKDDDQEINMSAESKGKNNVTSSQNEEKEDLQEKNDHNEDNEGGFIKSGESVHEETEEIKSTAETKENTEHAITTSSSRQIEPAEETIEKNGEKTIENGENEITSREIDLEKNPENVCSLTQTNSKEEILENKETNEEPIDNEKEQESAVPELHRGEDNAVSSRDAYNEDTKTAIGQDATTTVQFEEGLDVNAITKEITGEEVENKSIHAEEAGEQSENEAKTKIEQPEESINEPVNSCSDTIEESIKEEADARINKGIESEQEAENQADKTEDRTEIKNEVVLAEKVSKELEQTKEQNVEEVEACLTETISEKTEDKITKDDDLSHDSIEQINRNITKEEECFPDVIIKEIEISALESEPVKEQNDSQDVSEEKLTDLNEISVEPQEDTAPSSSLETSIEDATNSDKAEAVNEYLPKDLESVSEVHIPEVMPKSEDSKTKEECHVSATDIGTVTKDISSYENLETHGSTQQPENSYSTTEENVTQSEVQLNNTEGCSEIVKDVILTEEIEQVPLEIEKEKEINDFKEQIVEEDSYSPELEKKSAENQKELVHEISNSDSIPAENPEVTEVSVDGHIGQEDLQGKEDISCVSKVTTDVDQEPKEEGISSLEDAATVESEVDLSNRESTAYPLEGEKLATRALESDCDVNIPEVVADSEGSKVKEVCVVLATAEHADENNVEKQDTKTDEISSAPDNEQETVTETPTKSDEAKNSDLIIEEKALTKENLEIHGELEPVSESMIEEQVIIETKPQPEQSEITCENIKNDQTSESKVEEEFTLASENEIKSIESQNETTKNIILTDEVAVETEKEKEINEIERQVSEKDNSPTELDSTSTPDQKELANEIGYSKPIADANTEVAEVKAEIQTEVEDIKAAEDLSCLSKASSNIETSKVEIHQDTEQTTKIKEVKADSIYEASKDTTVPVLEDSKSSELLSTDRELVSELQTFSEEQTKINESCIESEDQGNFGAEIKDEKSEKEAVEDVIINEVIVEDEKAKESKSIKDIINEEAKLNQLTTQTDEVSQIEKSSSRPDELPGTKDPVEDTEELRFIADSLNVKDETLTVIKEPNEEKETVASEYKLENTVTDKEKETLDEPQTDDSLKTTYDSILSSTKPTEDSEIVPECREVSAILTDNLPEASPEMFLAKHEDKITKDREGLPSVEKDVINVQKHEKDLDHETELRTADVVSDVECSEIKPRHLDTKEATLEFNNQEKQKGQKKEADEIIEAVIPVKDVKTSTREPEVVLVDLEAPSVIDATAEKANNKTVETQLESTCDQSKPTEESFGIKQEPSELDASKTLGTAAAEDLKISPKYVTDDLIEVSQTYPEVQKYEVPAGTESKILTEKIDSSHKQEEPAAEPLIPEAAKMKPDMTSVFIDQKEKSESVVPAKILFQEHAKEKSEVAKDQQVDKEETEVKTDEEYEDEDNEDDEKTGSCSDAPVMVEASKDIEVKAHKKSHNILSGVGSKVKHSIAKVKKAITGKSSPPKPPSPKVKDQVIG